MSEVTDVKKIIRLRPSTLLESSSADDFKFEDELCSRRLALFFDARNESVTDEYADFLKECSFNVKRSLEQQYESKLGSCLSDSVNNSEVQQLIVVVIAGNAFMKDVLDFMTMGTFPNCQNRCLLFCRAGEESLDDTKLANEFSNANFKYKCTTIAYIVAKETKSVQGFYRSFLDDCRCSWETKSIFSILETALKLPLAYESLSLYHREGKLGGDFLRDIFKFIREPKSNLDEVDALPAASEQTAQDKPTDWMRENASIIYPNRRNPKKPRALVIIKYDRGDSLYSALQVDRSRVMRMLKNLGYIVTDVQTRSNDALKRRIELFSEDTEHGDSCILVVLSQTQQQLSSSTVMNLYKSLAIGEKLEAKPRLFILHEWDVTTLQTDSVTDGFSSNTYEIIEDAVDGLQAYFRNHDSTIKVHPHSGMVFGRSVSSDVTRAEGSAFIQTLCETFRQYGHTEDVASMITIINEHKRLDESVPKWFIQTGKLFYLMGTDGIQATGQEVSQQSLQKKSKEPKQSLEKKSKEPESARIDRTGFAMILTEGQFDGARNYQMFLEYAAFKVLFDYTDGNSSSIKTAIRLPKETEGNVVLYLIVRTHRNDNVLQEIVDELSKQQSSQKCSSSILLIFCEVSESEENFANTQMPEELPEKFSLVRVCRNRCGVIEFLDSLLESPRKNISLNGSFVVGRDFSCHSCHHGIMHCKVNDENPGWRKRITWLENFYIEESSSHPNLSSIDVSDDTQTRPAIRGSLRLESFRSEWNAPGLDTQECKAVALIVHNVVFQKKELSTRFGSQYDCQRMADTLLRLGYSVSIRSNLTKVEIESELDMFCSDARHGSSVVVAFMSHGCLGEVVGFDGESAKESKILKRISKGNRTSEKQQLVIFQNCLDPGRLPKSELSFFPGMIVAHSTSPNESSYRMTDRGSRFIQCLCTVLDLFADTCDIASMVPIVNYVVQNATFYMGISQLPWWSVQTSKKFWIRVNEPPQSSRESRHQANSARNQTTNDCRVQVTELLQKMRL
uniref:CASPASE_P20 domain-containing protein n=2 Tax=Macrostomum lignano TaxID=282301 RepID=A0A1I8J0J1_9PLAT